MTLNRRSSKRVFKKVAKLAQYMFNDDAHTLDIRLLKGIRASLNILPIRAAVLNSSEQCNLSAVLPSVL